MKVKVKIMKFFNVNTDERTIGQKVTTASAKSSLNEKLSTSQTFKIGLSNTQEFALFRVCQRNGLSFKESVLSVESGTMMVIWQFVREIALNLRTSIVKAIDIKFHKPSLMG